MGSALISFFAIAVSLSSESGNAANQSARDTLARLAAFMPQSREAEIALARSAAPPSVSSAADVLALGPNGYEVVAKGNNGFVCYVERSWAKEPGDPEFWNPKVRAPNCMNPEAVRSVLRSYIEKTKWVLAGATEDEVRDRIEQNVKTGKFSPPQPGAMTYMMSKDQYLQDNGHPWRPHVMFYFPSSAAPRSWGADLDGSPIISDTSAKLEHMTVFMVPVARWSDGSPSSVFPPATAH